MDVKGKVAVQTLHPQAGAFSERTRTTERARELAKRGAVAVLNVIEQAGNMHVRDFSNCGVPCFNLGTDDGRFLETVVERAAAAGVADELRVADHARDRNASGPEGAQHDRHRSRARRGRRDRHRQRALPTAGSMPPETTATAWPC